MPYSTLTLAGLAREAALRLAAEPSKVLDIALDCGFGDVSNFNRTFRAEFVASLLTYRGIQKAVHAGHDVSKVL
jgi:AraC family transcriptional regulator